MEVIGLFENVAFDLDEAFDRKRYCGNLLHLRTDCCSVLQVEENSNVKDN